jgi:serine/threonine-protein kinase
VYSEAPAYNIRASTLVWTSRDGAITPLPLPPAVYDHPRLSADGRSIVVHKEEGGDRNLWLFDTARDTLSKFTFASTNNWPVWSADSSRLMYASNRPGTQYDIYSKPADGSGPEQPLLARPLTQIPRAASPTGETLIFEETYADRPNTLWRMPLREKGEPRRLFGPGAGEMMPTFSSDGRWIGYVSPQSARNEVYVRSSTGEGSTWQISNDGGVEPVWSFSGRELFYRVNDKMMVVDVRQSPTISFGKPRVLFEGSYIFDENETQAFDVSRDGGRFLMLRPQRVPNATPLNVIVNWFDDLRRRAPASK